VENYEEIRLVSVSGVMCDAADYAQSIDLFVDPLYSIPLQVALVQ
jgi:hypothetical protein